MPSYKFDNQPDRLRIASMLGIDQYSLNLTQNADGSWQVVIPNDTLSDSVTDRELQQMKTDSGGDVDVTAG